jgi:hypothetical protein
MLPGFVKVYLLIRRYLPELHKIKADNNAPGIWDPERP